MNEDQNQSIVADVVKMIEALQHDRVDSNAVLYLPDQTIQDLGGDPEAHPQLEGYPGVRVVQYNGNKR